MNKMSAAILPICLAAALAHAPAAKAADPLADPASIVTVQIENDAFSIPSTDRYYTTGERFGYVTPTGAVPGFVSHFGNLLFGAGAQRMEIDVQQEIFTPVDTQAYNPDPNDRPYAGHLAIDAALIQDTSTTRNIVEITGGVVGPDSLGQSVQNGFHSIIGNTPSRGWRYQLKNEPTLDLTGGRIWRDDLVSFGDSGIGLQLLPQVTAQVGNTEIYAQAGALLRIGSGLDSDYGAAVMQPAMTGTDAYTPTQPFVWYIFAGGVGRVVAHDMLVQGNDFRSSRGVTLTPLQADGEIGGAVILFGLRVTATEVFETAEFHHEAPAFQYGSIAISSRF